MRIVDLTRAAAQAEVLRIKALALRNVRRAAFLAVAGALAAIALAALEFAFFFVLELDARITPAWSVIIVAGANLALAGVFGLVGSAGGPGPIEIEARMTRDRSLAELRNAMAIATVTGPAGRLAGRGVFNLVRKRFGTGRRRHRV